LLANSQVQLIHRFAFFKSKSEKKSRFMVEEIVRHPIAASVQFACSFNVVVVDKKRRS